jgi:hypothetical protein
MSRLCIILIHSPGLTFDDNTPEFATCLAASVRASTELLLILRLPDLEPFFLSFSPIGPGLVFVCAVMHVFYHCKSKILNLVGFPTLQESTNLISHAITLLERCPCPEGESLYETESIDYAIAILRNLAELMQPGSSQSPSWLTEPLIPLDLSLGLSLFKLNYQLRKALFRAS